MRGGNRSRLCPEINPERMADELLKLFPEKYKGYNILAGKAVLMVVKDHRLLSGSYRKSNRLWEVKK
jgi:hypothetical protein